jgi:hypothetical protein
MTSLEGVSRPAVNAAELGASLSLGDRGCPLFTVSNGPLMARARWLQRLEIRSDTGRERVGVERLRLVVLGLDFERRAPDRGE